MNKSIFTSCLQEYSEEEVLDNIKSSIQKLKDILEGKMNITDKAFIELRKIFPQIPDKNVVGLSINLSYNYFIVNKQGQV